jgi:CheY-like chemotaxis protein
MPERLANILVAEDEILVSKLIADVLCDYGFEVHAVTDAEAALRYLASDTAVDALFTDINLAGEMDGSVLARLVREQRPELPIVYCSGRYSPSELPPPVPRSVFVHKPYDLARLCTLLERLTSTAH